MKQAVLDAVLAFYKHFLEPRRSKGALLEALSFGSTMSTLLILSLAKP